jgi:hypothetical protein
MERSNDPALVRVGVSLGSGDGISSAKLMGTVAEVLARMMNLLRLVVVTSPILVQCFFLHQVDFVSWLMRLFTIYALAIGTCFVAVPEQMYNGLGLSDFRWLFELFYPGIAASNGSIADVAEPGASPLLAGRKASELGGTKARLKWHGTNRYMCITRDGWAVTGDEKVATTFLFHHVLAKEKRVSDTYTLKIADPGFEWHQAHLSFQPINHLRFGGWLGAYRDMKRACPYKVVQDSACPTNAFKLLCAWTSMPPPAQRYCSGFYVAEQLCGGQLYVGHASDRDAAFLELVLIA